MPIRVDCTPGQPWQVFMAPDEPYKEAKPEDFDGWVELGFLGVQ